jgi:hypothetical protein
MMALFRLDPQLCLIAGVRLRQIAGSEGTQAALTSTCGLGVARSLLALSLGAVILSEVFDGHF